MRAENFSDFRGRKPKTQKGQFIVSIVLSSTGSAPTIDKSESEWYDILSSGRTIVVAFISYQTIGALSYCVFKYLIIHVVVLVCKDAIGLEKVLDGGCKVRETKAIASRSKCDPNPWCKSQNGLLFN